MKKRGQKPIYFFPKNKRGQKSIYFFPKNKRGQKSIYFFPKNKRGQKSIYFFPKNKRGQYYLVAAMVFLGLFFILISGVNQSKKETNTKIYELQKEMRIESSKVLEYYALTGNNKIENFTKEYSNYAGQETNIYFITGNRTTQQVYNYTNGNKMNLNSFSFNSANNILSATIEGKIYSFEFEKGENFYFIITQKEEDEIYILRG
jgi:hypothetical protein